MSVFEIIKLFSNFQYYFDKLTTNTVLAGTYGELIQILLLGMKVSKVGSLYRPWRPLGLREVEAPIFSDIRLTDGGKVVSPTRRLLFTPRKIPGAHFC
jgi:hypothetical protein